MPLMGRKPKLLDGKKIFELWIRLGAIPKVSAYLIDSGEINPETKKPFNLDSIWRACITWMVYHPEDAREKYKEYGEEFSDEHWRLYLLRKALQVFGGSRTGFFRWVITQEWPKQYEKLYAERFQPQPDDYDYFNQTTRRMPKESKEFPGKKRGPKPKNLDS